MKEQFLSFSEHFYRFLADHLGYTHPVHPTFVNMPIGLVTGALILIVLALLARRTTLRVSARHCIIVAFLFLFPTILAGVMDWQQFLRGAWIFPIQAKIGLAVILFLLLLWGILLSRKPEKRGLLLLISFLGFCDVVALGYFGGEIVFGGRVPQSTEGHENGQMIFQNNCSGCHPYGGNILVPEKPLIYSDHLRSLDTLLEWLRNPKPPMPSFPAKDMPDEQVRELYDYLSEMWAAQSDGEKPPQGQSSPPGAPSAPDQSGEIDPTAPRSWMPPQQVKIWTQGKPTLYGWGVGTGYADPGGLPQAKGLDLLKTRRDLKEVRSFFFPCP